MKIKKLFSLILVIFAIMMFTVQIYAESSDKDIVYGAQLIDNEIHYLSSNGRWVKNCIYGVSKERANGLLIPGYWRFDENGCALFDNGLREDPDGELRYYVEGVATYAGLIVGDDGYCYYINSTKKAVKNCTYSIGEAKCNGIFPAGTYNFDEVGRMYIEIPSNPWDDVIIDRFYIRFDE